MPELNVYGEFLLDIDEWDKIHFINLHGRERLNKDWTAVFSDKISKIYPACVLKFNNYWYKKSSSRKINSPCFRACAECKFSNCLKFDFYIDDPITTNTITIQYIPNGYLSLQHSDGETVYARQVSGSYGENLGKFSSTHLLRMFFINSLFVKVDQWNIAVVIFLILNLKNV